MDKLSNFVNFLKYSHLEFDSSKNFKEIINDITNFDVFSCTYYLNLQLKQSKYILPKVINNIEKTNQNNNKLLIKIKQTNKQKFYNNLYKDNEESKYGMKMQSSLAQKFFNEQKLFDLQQPKHIIESLENQFTNLKIISQKEISSKQKTNILKENNKNENSRKQYNEKKIIYNKNNSVTKRIVEKEFHDGIIFDNIETIKKKNKLLEFIVLQKVRNNELLKNESNKI